MRVVVGLGNPGEKYKITRHNVGFIVLDELVSGGWKFEQKFNAETMKDDDILYVKPQTFMNNSGESVSKIVDYYNVAMDDLIVIHDDVDLLFGDVKNQRGRGTAGHKGVASIADRIGSNEFWRVRIGVGRPVNGNVDTEDWVLSDLLEAELEKVREIARGLLPL